MKIGVLLMNTGTPDAPTQEAVARYLGQFLMDPAIISVPAFVRKRLVRHICKTRPQKTLKNYLDFWDEDGSPFLKVSRDQAQGLACELERRMPAQTHVVLAMRYGNPSIASGLDELRAHDCDCVILLPCYPQQVNVCAGTCLKESREQIHALQAHGWNPQLIEIPSFYAQPAYQAALIESVRDAWTYPPGAKLLVSFHSTLIADIEAGDPYCEQAEATRAFLAHGLGIADEDALLCYQSRFDSRKWLQPFTEALALQLARAGVKDLCIVAPIFTADNLETRIDIDRTLRRAWLDIAGADARFTYVAALNSSAGLICALADAVQDALGGNVPRVMTTGIGADTALPGHIS